MLQEHIDGNSGVPLEVLDGIITQDVNKELSRQSFASEEQTVEETTILEPVVNGTFPVEENWLGRNRGRRMRVR